MGSFRYCRVKYIVSSNYRPSHAVAPSEIGPEGATGFGTQLVLKYLYNESSKTDIHKTDFTDPTLPPSISTNLPNPFDEILTKSGTQKH